MFAIAFDAVRLAVLVMVLLVWLMLCVAGVLLMLIVWPLFVIALFL